MQVWMDGRPGVERVSYYSSVPQLSLPFPILLWLPAFPKLPLTMVLSFFPGTQNREPAPDN